MRQTCIFSGSSHPQLVDSICERLGQKASHVELKKFSNGETSVEIKTSVRDQNVFIVQSGSSQINDNVMELLIMIAACKGGSARSITAVMPYFPYSRQSKKKTHRGAITARMLANLMKVAGVNHVITIDLHASQMQGFFQCPVDNLFAEPLLGRWIKTTVQDWPESVVVSKNPGGTKRATSLADRLGLSFGIVTTDRSKPRGSPIGMMNSVLLASLGADALPVVRTVEDDSIESQPHTPDRHTDHGVESPQHTSDRPGDIWAPKMLDFAQGHRSPRIPPESPVQRPAGSHSATALPGAARSRLGHTDVRPSPLAQSSHPDSTESVPLADLSTLERSATAPGVVAPSHHDEDGYEEPENEDDPDERARDVITGRLVHGHIVDDDVPSPALSVYSAHGGNRRSSEDEDPMTQSFMSTTSSRWNGTHSAHHYSHGLGGSGDAAASEDEEEEALANPEVETTVTLVGNVRDKPVIIVDDMIDKVGSWIAAAETVVKRGGATKVYCMATHGLFSADSLRQLDECAEIEAVVITNAFPIPAAYRLRSKKLVVIEVSGLLAEAIRRNHHGESISQLYHLMD